MADLSALEARKAAAEAKKAEVNEQFKSQRAAKQNKDDSIKQTTKDSIGSLPVKKHRVSLILPDNMFNALEAECKKIGATKNGYIINMLAKKLDVE